MIFRVQQEREKRQFSEEELKLTSFDKLSDSLRESFPVKITEEKFHFKYGGVQPILKSDLQIACYKPEDMRRALALLESCLDSLYLDFEQKRWKILEAYEILKNK